VTINSGRCMDLEAGHLRSGRSRGGGPASGDQDQAEVSAHSSLRAYESLLDFLSFSLASC
jgi:hypothetical protein